MEEGCAFSVRVSRSGQLSSLLYQRPGRGEPIESLSDGWLCRPRTGGGRSAKKSECRLRRWVRTGPEPAATAWSAKEEDAPLVDSTRKGLRMVLCFYYATGKRRTRGKPQVEVLGEAFFLHGREEENPRKTSKTKTSNKKRWGSDSMVQRGVILAGDNQRTPVESIILACKKFELSLRSRKTIEFEGLR